MVKKLSIVTINYNNAEGLRSTANSICTQNTKTEDIEWLVIDGGSTDGSLDIINEHRAYIDYWVSERDGGIFDAMNKGLQQASGTYIVFMNAGDCFVEGLLTKSFIQGLQGDIYYGDIYLLLNGKRMYSKQTDYPDFVYMLGRTLCHQSVFMKTALCKKYPFRTDYSIMGDWIQLFSILKKEQPEVVYIPKPICIYDADGLSNKQAELRKQQRSAYLRTQYAAWELQGLKPIVRLRGRDYYEWVLSTLDRWRRQIVLKWVSRLF